MLGQMWFGMSRENSVKKWCCVFCIFHLRRVVMKGFPVGTILVLIESISNTFLLNLKIVA